jgi:hypothetical protein
MIGGKEVPLEGEELEEYESKFSELLEKQGTLVQPAVISEEYDDDGSQRTITTVVTRREIVTSGDADGVGKELETEGFHVEPEVLTEEQEGGLKRTITRVVTEEVEMGPAFDLGEFLGKQHIEGIETHPEIITKEQENGGTIVEAVPEKGALSDNTSDNQNNVVQGIMDKGEDENSQNETKVVTEEQDEDGTKRTITRVVTTKVGTSPMSEFGTQDSAVVEVLEKIQKEAGLEESETTTEEHEENGGKTTVTRVTTRKKIPEPKLMSDGQCREMLQQFEIETQASAQSEIAPVVSDVTEQDSGVVKRTVTKVVTRTVKTEPTIISGDEDSSIKEMMEQLKKQEKERQDPEIEAKGDDKRMVNTGIATKVYQTGLSETAGQENIGDSASEGSVSYQDTMGEDGTVTTVTTFETSSCTFEPMVLEEHADVLKEMLERSDDVSVETAPSAECEGHGDGHVVREMRREVREVTTMESKTELGKGYELL